MIADTWSPDELLTQVALARLEGRGKDPMRLAELMAHISNTVELALWRLGKTGESPPKLIPPSAFLPKRVKSKPADQRIRKDLKRQTSLFNRLAGFK